MKEKTKYMLGAAAVVLVWAALVLFCWLRAPDDISESERRKLAQMPELSAGTLLSGDFMEDFESYTLDQFPLRDSFRTLKAVTAYYVFGQKDNNGIYIADGYAAKLEYPLKESSVESAADKIEALYNTYMKDTGVKVYVAGIPDKGYFLAEKNGYPSLDYERMFEILKEGVPFATYVDITSALEIEDYYRTDTHWKQTEIVGVAEILGEAMGIDVPALEDYREVEAGVPFYGVYYGQAALPLASETIEYLTNDVLDACTVFNVETNKTTGIYDLEKLEGQDPYDVFLSGAAAVLYIENPNAATDRELVVFRDSFGSSLVPLLVQNYAKVTLVDTRYVVSDLVGQFVEFDDQDVLFMYSALVLNQSAVLR